MEREALKEMIKKLEVGLGERTLVNGEERLHIKTPKKSNNISFIEEWEKIGPHFHIFSITHT